MSVSVFALTLLLCVFFTSFSSATVLEVDTLKDQSSPNNNIEATTLAPGTTSQPPQPTHHHNHFVPSIITLKYCDGIRCAKNCRTQKLLAGYCYHDLNAGQHVRFQCGAPANTSNTCFRGYGFNDSNCKRFDEVSRNSLVCNSCSNGKTVFDCSLTNALLEKTNCTNCQNCTQATRYQLNACHKTPQNGTWGQVSYLGSCGSSIVVKTTYASWFGCFGTHTQKPYQIGYPANFCTSGTTRSRAWGCVKPQPHNVTTTTSAPEAEDDNNKLSVEEILASQKVDSRGNLEINLPSDDEFHF